MTCRPLRFALAILPVLCAAPVERAAAQTTQPADAHVARVVHDETLEAHATDGPPRHTSGTASHPTASTWTTATGHFVEHLIAGNAEEAWIHVAPRARIDEFDPDAPATFARLVDLAKRTTLLGVHAYDSSPTRLAEDIAADVREAEAVPEELRRRMTPKDEDEAARANATAAQWLVQNLSAEKGQPLATVVLWDEAASQVVFILAKGSKSLTTHGGFQITHVVFGNPLTVPR